MFLTISSALRDGARHPLGGGRQHDLGAERLEQPAALQAHALGHRDHQLVAARGAGEGQARCPVLPLVGSTISVSLVILPSASAASIIATPIRSLTDQSGLKFSSFATTVGLAALASPAGAGSAACCRSSG